MEAHALIGATINPKTYMNPDQKKIGMAVLFLALAGAIGIWWIEYGRFQASPECKAATEQLAELRVEIKTRSILKSMYLAQAKHAVERYCKRWP